MGLEEGKHGQIALCLRGMNKNDSGEFNTLWQALEAVYHCTNNNVDNLLKKYSDLDKAFKIGTTPEVLLKVLKWLFIMEDIVYWDVEGRAFLYNFLLYVINEEDEERLEEAMGKINTPDKLKSFMKKAGITWVAHKD